VHRSARRVQAQQAASLQPYHTPRRSAADWTALRIMQTGRAARQETRTAQLPSSAVMLAHTPWTQSVTRNRLDAIAQTEADIPCRTGYADFAIVVRWDRQTTRVGSLASVSGSMRGGKGCSACS